MDEEDLDRCRHQRALVSGATSDGLQSVPGNCRHSALADPSFPAVVRLDPNGELFRSLTGIASHAASGDIPASYDTCVVDDVLPGRKSTSRSARRCSIEHSYAAVDALPVSFFDLLLEPLRDLPPIHVVVTCRTTIRLPKETRHPDTRCLSCRSITIRPPIILPA